MTAQQQQQRQRQQHPTPASTSTSTSGTAAADAPPAPVVTTVSTGSAAQLAVLHQRTNLSFSYDDSSSSAAAAPPAPAPTPTPPSRSRGGGGGCRGDGDGGDDGGGRGRGGGAGDGDGGRWGYGGVTTLYCIDTAAAAGPGKGGQLGPTTTGRRRREIGLHFRRVGGMEITSVGVHGAIPVSAGNNGGRAGGGVKRKLDGGDGDGDGGGDGDASGEKENRMVDAMEVDRGGEATGGASRADRGGRGATAAAADGERPVGSTAELRPLPTQYLHLDPLHRVLQRHAPTRDGEGTKFHADAQSNRGGHGMALNLRAAGIGCTLGEVRVVFDFPPAPPGDGGGGSDDDDFKRVATECWRNDLLHPPPAAAEDEDGENDDGEEEEGAAAAVARRHSDLIAALHGPGGGSAAAADADAATRRRARRRSRRIDLVSRALGAASSSPSPSSSPPETTVAPGGGGAGNTGRTTSPPVPSPPPAAAAFKIVVRFRMNTTRTTNLTPRSAGLLLFSHPNNTPHAYTTSGTFGDAQGPRMWMPCLDSPGSSHRSSHELGVDVVAAAGEGLSVVGCGEDTASRTTLFYHATTPRRGGGRGGVGGGGGGGGGGGRLMARHVWCSVTWGPAPARGLGFAVGPFVTVVDPECIPRLRRGRGRRPRRPHVRTADADAGCGGGGGKDGDGGVEGEKRGRGGDGGGGGGGRKDGAGDEDEDGDDDDDDGEEVGIIRQAYFAPRYERHLLHNPQTCSTYPISTSESPSLSYSATTCAPVINGGDPNRPGGEASRAGVDVDPLSRAIETTVTRWTSGVPLRALHLMRRILAVPAYRSSHYVQVWIPDAVDGGSSVGCLDQCDATNAFVGGCIVDAALLPRPNAKLPYYAGGRALQMLQARNAMVGWVTSAITLGGRRTAGTGASGMAAGGSLPTSSSSDYDNDSADVDEVGEGYLHAVFVRTLLNFYERAYGASGEGGSKHSYYHVPRYAANSGTNSSCMDAVLGMSNNVEDEDDVGVGVGGIVGTATVPGEERGNDELWRSANNGTESRTSASDEFSIRQVLMADTLEAVERVGPLPSMGWQGSKLSLSFLSSNSTNATVGAGCGTVDLLHPIGGLVYRSLKSTLVAKVTAARAGVTNLIRVMRACFIASLLMDAGETRVPNSSMTEGADASEDGSNSSADGEKKQQPYVKLKFVACIDEIMKKGGITHIVFARSLRVLAGPTREPYLVGTLVDVGRDIFDSRGDQLTVPEGFPNSYVRGCSGLYLRAGAHVEVAGQDSGSQTAAQPMVAVKGIHLHMYAEPVIPEAGCAYSGPIVLRVVENESQCREFVRTLNVDGSRSEWGPIFLHAKPVTSAKQQTAASGTIEGSGGGAKSAGATNGADGTKRSDGAAGVVFSDEIHSGAYQALELVRLTNRTPLLWVRVDPHGLYGGRIAIFQPDACLGEQLFHDSDTSGQIEAIRALAERPLRIQGSVNIHNVYDVDVNELPVRLLGDCLRGSAALHSSLPHTPAVRVQAALAIAQWQNNKAPASKDAVGSDSWIGLKLLIQYFNERFTGKSSTGDVAIMPVKYTRIMVQKLNGGEYQYLDEVEDDEKKALLDEADSIEVEEDEEYRVRAAVVTAIACIRAKDGNTPPLALKFLEAIIPSCDGATMTDISATRDINIVRKAHYTRKEDAGLDTGETVEDDVASEPFSDIDLPYIDNELVAEALLALSYVHVRPSPHELDDIVGTGGNKSSGSQSTLQAHPIQPLLNACYDWLKWALYKESVLQEINCGTLTGVGGGSFTMVTPCAITSSCLLSLLKQSTTSTAEENDNHSNTSVVMSLNTVEPSGPSGASESSVEIPMMATAQFYKNIFDSKPARPDSTRAAAAQALLCICCAADRLRSVNDEALGLLTALDFLLDRIIDPTSSPALRQTLSALMMDACTGKVCSTQRVASIAGRNDLCTAGSRFMCGPLGASHGGDNGSALLMAVSEGTYPAANAVNDGARLGLRLLSRSGLDSTHTEETVVQVARFASKLWRTINGEMGVANGFSELMSGEGVCVSDGYLRTSLLALWQWVFPKGCIAVLRVQSWRSLEGTQRYKELGATEVMKINEEEKEAAMQEEASLNLLNEIVSRETKRQQWRCDMAKKAYDNRKRETKKVPTAAAQGLGQPLPMIKRDIGWKLGGWVASTAQQRRHKSLDGGTAVTKLRLMVKSGGAGDA